MSKIYDNWERLVAAVLKKEQLWKLFHEHSRSPSTTSLSSDMLETLRPVILTVCRASIAKELSCIEGSLILVDEYIDHLNLRHHLMLGEEPLPWSIRVQIALDLARGLEYLHEHTDPVYIHCNITSTNIYIDENLRAKVRTFGLTKVNKVGSASLQHGRHLGTSGYMSPELLLCGDVSPKIDVYAFGVVLFELISAKQATEGPNGLVALFEEAFSKPDQTKSLKKLVDRRLGDDYPHNFISRVAYLAKACTHENPLLRPSMRSIVVALMTWSSSAVGTLNDIGSLEENDHLGHQMSGHSCLAEEKDEDVQNLRQLGEACCSCSEGGAALDTFFMSIPGALAPLLSHQVYVSLRLCLFGSFETPSESSPLHPDTSPKLYGITVDNKVEFTYQELAEATKNFNLLYKIEQGFYGSVFYGELRGEEVAIKKMDMKASREFLTEMKVLTHAHHVNLVLLIGYCVEGSLFLVYDYIDNGNLSKHLRGKEVRSASLTTRLVGTFGYMPPEYCLNGDVSPKTDVYAFGVVLFELVSAKEAIVSPCGLVSLLDQTKSLQKLVDPRLCADYPFDSVYKIACLAKACTHENPQLRPSMRSIVVALMTLV
ncbi:hypothetical protein RD792_007664 [Penstemon davidsonii]|uniref:Protein kinase domain-containing protein n=1 Tax=Penstemon davidsonii TaxID=160366 RepID=A0ABR0D717_9LAMI|nr:hypothetical protein RD792_007664 [Penstemon davidsonii]